MPGDNWSQILYVILPILVPVVAMVSVTTVVIVNKIFSHRERMGMIERGIHPDYPPENEEEKQNP
jgi:hypothetical protein